MLNVNENEGFPGQDEMTKKIHGNRCLTVAIKCKRDDRCECSHDTTGKMNRKYFQALNGIRTHDLCVTGAMLISHLSYYRGNLLG